MPLYNSIQLNGKIYSANNIDQFEQIEEWQKHIVAFLKEWFDTTSTLFVNTSGSTGTPKNFELNKQSMVNSAKATIEYFGLTPSTQALLCLPASHIAGKMMLVRAIVGNFNLICTQPSKQPFSSIATNIHFAALTPYQLSYSLTDIQKKKPHTIILGGAATPTPLSDAIQNQSTAFYETYGMTETCSHIAVKRINGTHKSDNFRTLKDIQIRLNEQNCLCIHAPQIHNKELITNDIAEIINKSEFRIIGRLDNVINSGGIKIHPEQIEKKLDAVINRPFFVGSLPDPNLGQKVVLVIEGNPFDKMTEKDLVLKIADLLTPFEKPKEIKYCSSFIRTASNKLQKKESLDISV